jgi:hypothetical protein
MSFRRKKIKAAALPQVLQFSCEGSLLKFAASAPEDGKPDIPLVNLVAYTGVAMRLPGLPYPVVIDLDTAKARRSVPLLRDHDPKRIAGHTTVMSISADGIHSVGLLSGDDVHAGEVIRLGRKEYPWQTSVGADPGRMQLVKEGSSVTVNGRRFDGPIFVARGSEVREISILSLGADGNTSANVAASFHGENQMDPQFKAWLEAQGFNAETLTAKQIAPLQAAYDAEDDEDDEDAKKKADAKRAKAAMDDKDKAECKASLVAELKAEASVELKRQADIRKLCAGYETLEIKVDDKNVNLLAHAVESGWDGTKVELEVLRAQKLEILRGSRGTGPAIHHGVTQENLTDSVLEAALLQATRHQFHLEDDSFYLDEVPGLGKVRRVSQRMQREVQGELKARYTDQVQQTAHTLFKGRVGCHQFFDSALRRSGITAHMDMKTQGGWENILRAWHDMEGRMIQASGASNLSVSNILANVLNKFSLQGYLFVEQAWREIAAIRPVNDFKPTKSINLLGNAMYKQLGSTGQLQDANFGDQAFANQANPYGIIATIPWTHLVNDDLGMFAGVPSKIGQGAGLALNDYFWALWASLASGSVVGVIPTGTNLNGDDGNAFWRTSSSNTAAARRAGTAYLPNKDTGAALSATTLKSGKAMFENQIDPNGNPLGFDALTPTLLFGPSNWQTAMSLLESEYIVAAGLASTSALSTLGSKNPWRGQFKPVMSKYVENANYVNSATAFWMLFNPMALAVIEACFLNGVDTPAVLQAGPDYQFDKPGISIRGTMPFGVTQQQFRGGVFNAGA